jgi:hypothetical protein
MFVELLLELRDSILVSILEWSLDSILEWNLDSILEINSRIKKSWLLLQWFGLASSLINTIYIHLNRDFHFLCPILIGQTRQVSGFLIRQNF